MDRVWIGIGSNLSNPKKQVDHALEALSQLPLTVLVSHSSYYCSDPLGIQDAPNFLNAVAVLDTQLYPEELLIYIQTIENQQGRIRKFNNRWISRTLDLDILLFGKHSIDTANLIVPHYDMENREFVMYPLIEIDDDLILPNGKKIKEVINSLSETKLSFWKT